MASTEVGNTLTEQHRQAQLALRNAFLRELIPLWPMLASDALDETVAAWVNAVANVVLLWRARSAERALDYYARLRQAEAGETLPDRALHVNLAPANFEQIRTSLLVTGPIGMKSRIAAGFSPAQARRMSFTAVAGSASRHVLNGGRQQLIQTATKDEMAVGFSRITDGDPCAFCAMLAGRGAVYLSRRVAIRTTERSKRGANEKYHDNCGCTVEPSFDRQTDIPERNRAFAQLWADSTKGHSGKAAIREFRRAYRAQQLGA